MSESWDKDAWVKLAFALKCIECDRIGNIYRNTEKNETGKIKWRQYKLQTHSKSGRVYINLTFRGKTKSVLVNRAVALRYLPNPLKLPEVNHIDGNKSNNRLNNLEWASRSDQEKHAFRTGLKATRGSSNSNAKLTVEQVLHIRDCWSKGSTTRALSKAFGVSPSTINNITKRKTWVHL